MEPILEEKYKGYVIKICVDENALDPREWDDCFGKMVCFHRRYDLGDKHLSSKLSLKDLNAIIAEPNVVFLPLYLLDHSGLWMNTGGFWHVDPQGWDWGLVGAIYADAEAIFKEFGSTDLTDEIRQKAKQILQNEVDTYNKFLCGEVFGYVIEGPDGEFVDSCWGFYEDPEEVLKWVREEIKHLPHQLELPIA